MITQILVSTESPGIARPRAARNPRLPRNPIAAGYGGVVGLLARWWARRRQYDELAALSDYLRADLGVAPRNSQLEEQLRFIATPDRFELSGWKPGRQP